MKKFAVIGILILVALVVASAIPAAAQSGQQAQPPLTIGTDLDAAAQQLLSSQQYDKAVLDLSLFIMLNPTYSPGYYDRAQGYLGLNDMTHALQDVNTAIDTATGVGTPDYSAALYAMRGQIDQQQKDLQAALKDFNQSITIKPSAQALASRGGLYISTQDFQSALQDFNAAIKLDSSNPTYYVYLGLIHTALKDPESSGKDYLQFFSMIQNGQIHQQPLQSGQSTSLQIDQGVLYELPFTATAGQYASAIAVARTGNVDPLMVLIDSQGNPLYGDDDSGSNGAALILNYKVPADGQYALIVGHSLGGTTGTVLVQLQVSDTPQQ